MASASGRRKAEPSSRAATRRGLATIGGFMAFWGWAFIASTLAVLVGGRGKDEHGPPLVGARASRRVLGTYREMVAVPPRPLQPFALAPPLALALEQPPRTLPLPPRRPRPLLHPLTRCCSYPRCARSRSCCSP